MTTPTPIHPNGRDQIQVEVLTGMGATEEFIAAHLRLTPIELHLHYKKQLTFGLEEANLKVAKAFFDMAVSGDYPQITIAWMKMRAGWSDAPSRSPTDLDPDDQDIEAARQKLLRLLNRSSK